MVTRRVARRPSLRRRFASAVPAPRNLHSDVRDSRTPPEAWDLRRSRNATPKAGTQCDGDRDHQKPSSSEIFGAGSDAVTREEHEQQDHDHEPSRRPTHVAVARVAQAAAEQCDHENYQKDHQHGVLRVAALCAPASVLTGCVANWRPMLRARFARLSRAKRGAGGPTRVAIGLTERARHRVGPAPTPAMRVCGRQMRHGAASTSSDVP
jgi:hypothetical protein